MKPYSEIENTRRLREALEFANRGGTLSDLAQFWGRTTPAVIQWLDRWAPDGDIRRKLAEAGRLRAGSYQTNLSTVDRLQMIRVLQSNGWSNERIARAIGISSGAFCTWIKRHAPDSLEQAIEDLTDDEQSAA